VQSIAYETHHSNGDLRRTIGLKLENGKWLLTNFACVTAAAK
jgi:hypothetical protein